MTAGDRDLVNGPIHLAPHDPDWALQYSQLEARVRAALGELALLVEHVGSTAVPGLAAKPVIDVILVVADSADEPSYAAALEAAGFRLSIREPGWFEHRLFQPPDGRCNLHVFSRGCDEVDRMLHFRNWLRNNDADRQRYEEAKRGLASRTWRHVQDYADAKSEVVRELLSRASAPTDGAIHENGSHWPPTGSSEA